MTDVNKIIFKVISLGLLAACLSIMLVSIALAQRDEAIYPSNVAVGGISIANLSQNEAQAKLKADLGEKWNNKLKIIIDKNHSSVSIPIKELGITYNVDASLAKVNAYLNTGSFLKHAVLRGEAINIAPVMDIKDKNLFNHKLVEIMKKVDKPAIDARVLYTKGYLEYVVHADGYIVKQDTSLDHIIDAINDGSLGPVALDLQDVYPKVKAEDIKNIKSLIGVSTSNLEPWQNSDPAFASLISRINGTVVMSGDEFSLNSALNQPTSMDQEAAARYQQMVLKISNTLINACQSAHLSMVSTAPGKAQFVNNSGNPLMIYIAIEDNKLLVKIFGCQTDKGKEIVLIKEQTVISPGIEVKVDRKLKPGDKIINQGQEGKKISTYRVVKINGEETERKLLSEEIIPPRNTVMTVAPGTTVK